jgi:hypothetical protein
VNNTLRRKAGAGTLEYAGQFLFFAAFYGFCLRKFDQFARARATVL